MPILFNDFFYFYYPESLVMQFTAFRQNQCQYIFINQVLSRENWKARGLGFFSGVKESALGSQWKIY